MKKNQILEAWRNEEYYLSLSAEERDRIPEHPSGLLDIKDDVLLSITGGCSNTLKYGCGGESTGLCTPCPPIECY